jgi:uncharacterized protein (TIGR02001 family)
MLHRAIFMFVLLVGMPPVIAEESAPSWGRLVPAISWTTDYRFNGVSASNRNPATQLSIHWWRPDDYYAGVWLSQVDFDDPNSTSFEIDTYAGRRFPAGESEYRVEVMYSAFDEDVQGPTYDFLQLKSAATRQFDHGSLTAALRWSPQGSYAAGKTTYADVEATVQINDWLSISSRVGAGSIERRPDRRFWDAGLTARWRTFSMDIRYVDNNLKFMECGFVDWCESALVATLTLASY